MGVPKWCQLVKSLAMDGQDRNIVSSKNHYKLIMFSSPLKISPDIFLLEFKENFIYALFNFFFGLKFLMSHWNIKFQKI